MTIIEKNLLSVTKGIICHQVNCKGVMNAGLAASIAKKYPRVLNQYLLKHKTSGWKLGEVQFVEIISEVLYVANIAGQLDYGRDKKVYTNYDALKEAFRTVKKFSDSKNLEIYVPFNFGSGLANGDWEKVKSIIGSTIPNCIICKLPIQSSSILI